MNTSGGVVYRAMLAIERKIERLHDKCCSAGTKHIPVQIYVQSSAIPSQLKPVMKKQKWHFYNRRHYTAICQFFPPSSMNTPQKDWIDSCGALIYHDSIKMGFKIYHAKIWRQKTRMDARNPNGPSVWPWIKTCSVGCLKFVNFERGRTGLYFFSTAQKNMIACPQILLVRTFG